MNIRGIYKTSLIDFPGRISTVLFCGGCNLRCRYCHNPDLACNRPNLEETTNEDALAFLEKRKGLIEGVTISGGEPTLSKGIDSFFREIKKIPLPIKLDTNGLKPDVLERLIMQDLIDYVAIDIKTSPEKYSDLSGTEVDFSKIIQSIELLKKNNIDFELRTTCIPEYVTLEDLESIKNVLGNVPKYYLQQFITDVPLIDNTLQLVQPYSTRILQEYCEFIESFSDYCSVRGV